MSQAHGSSTLLPSFLRNTDSSGSKIAISELQDANKQVVKIQGECTLKAAGKETYSKHDLLQSYIAVYLHPNDILCVMGSCDFCVYAGAVDIQGFTILEPRGQFFLLNSPPHSSSLCFRQPKNLKTCSILKNGDASKILPQNVVSAADELMQKNAPKVNGNETIFFSVLIFKQNNSSTRLSKAAAARAWFQRGLLSNNASIDSVMHGFALMLPNNRENERRVSIKHIVSMPQLWAASVKTILSSVFNCDVNDGKVDGITGYIEDSVKILVCGAKNTGKSTLGRYVVNRLLSYQYANKSYRARLSTRNQSGIERVAYMDTDIGQTEFTPPGFVSIFILDNSEPMLGPALPHWRKPLLSYFIGDVTPRSFPEMYLAAVKNLLVRYTNLKVEGHLEYHWLLILWDGLKVWV